MVVQLCVTFFSLPAILSLVQPWAGVAPYNMTPDDIAVLTITYSLVLMGAAIVANALLKSIGPIITMWIGYVVLIATFMLIGGPPAFFPNFPKNRTMVYMCLSLTGVGAGICIVAEIEGLVLALQHYGIKQSDVSHILGAYTAICPVSPPQEKTVLTKP